MALALHRIQLIPLLQGVDEKNMAILANIMIARNYAQNAVVFHKGAAVDHLAFVLRGKLQVVDLSEDGRAVGISSLKLGDYFGEMSVIDGQPRSTSIIATEPSEVAFLPRNVARQLMTQSPLVAEKVMTRLTQIIRRSANQRALLSIPNAFQRVVVQIQQLAEHGHQNRIETLPKQHEIAVMVNTSRETVSRTIHMLQKAGIIAKQGRVIVIQKPEQLQKVAENGVEILGGAQLKSSSAGLAPRALTVED